MCCLCTSPTLSPPKKNKIKKKYRQADMYFFFSVNTNTKNAFLNSMFLTVYSNEQFTFLSFRTLNINNKAVLGSVNITKNTPKYWPPLWITQ